MYVSDVSIPLSGSTRVEKSLGRFNHRTLTSVELRGFDQVCGRFILPNQLGDLFYLTSIVTIHLLFLTEWFGTG